MNNCHHRNGNGSECYKNTYDGGSQILLTGIVNQP